jgi:hypothetical protein
LMSGWSVMGGLPIGNSITSYEVRGTRYDGAS